MLCYATSIPCLLAELAAMDTGCGAVPHGVLLLVCCACGLHGGWNSVSVLDPHRRQISLYKFIVLQLICKFHCAPADDLFA
jgi:hypothetical protein